MSSVCAGYYMKDVSGEPKAHRYVRRQRRALPRVNG